MLVLRSLREETEESQTWRRSMPQDQVHEFNRLIAALNVANVELVALVAGYVVAVGELEARAAWWFSLSLQVTLAKTGAAGRAKAVEWDGLATALEERLEKLAQAPRPE